MTVEVACPHCSKTYRVKDESDGRLGASVELGGTSASTTVSITDLGPLTAGVSYEFWCVGHGPIAMLQYEIASKLRQRSDETGDRVECVVAWSRIGLRFKGAVDENQSTFGAPYFMHDTPATLLHRLCDHPVPGDWEHFVRLFTPLLRRWAVRFGVPDSAIEDQLQELFVLLIRKLPEYRYDASRSFRAWLWTVFRHAVLAWQKRQPHSVPALEHLEALSSPDSVLEATEAEYRRYLLNRIMQIVQTDFPSTTWQIFQQVVIDGRPGVDVAREFDVTVNSVYLARSRVLARLRDELAGLDG